LMRTSMTFAGWRGLAAEERTWLVRALMDLPLLRASLASRGYSATLQRIEQAKSTQPRTAECSDIERAVRLAKIAEIAGRRGIVTATCLPQSLWTYRMLRGWGLLPILRLGVRRSGGSMQAHAWVELQGTPLGSGARGHVPVHEHAHPGRMPPPDAA